MKILLTAFDPFGGETVNPAQQAVAEVVDKIGDVEIIKLVVPTVFGKAPQVVAEAIHAEKPDAVLCIGQAGGRPDLTVERIGINVDDARIADNAGNTPCDAPIVPEGPAAYFATLPIKAMVAAIREAGIPASVSNSAGTFVCNHLLYSVLHLTAGTNVKAGFMHVPFLPSQVKDGRQFPSMSKSDIVAGIEAALGAIAEAL